ncbi:AraC family transcriptional regulator [Mycolicibacterium sp. J2]|uniref:AraC family transcriptional regulator n=1 Tax=Mycolicibacterium sp. J2 TaxID=2993511 RepID=UPI00224B2B8D|nr:AraC family transcriptional regulator [Mycolicibacterium sp. J2]MCX2715359.1 AraC family transcriptional regulator [Mycolicibacterium sp. J2]
MASIRSSGLRGFRSTVAELGGDADRIARDAGLPVEALDSDGLFVDDAAMSTAYELAARNLACPDFGLRVAMRQDIGLLGPLALATQNSATMGEAIDAAVAYLFIHSKGMRLSMCDDPLGEAGVAALRLELSVPGYFPTQGTDTVLGFLHRAAHAVVGGPYGLRSIELPYTPVAPLEVYERFFGVPVHAGGTQALLRMSEDARTLPVLAPDREIRQLAVAMLRRLAPPSEPQITGMVRAAIAQSLGTSAVDIRAIARVLVVHPRTLQRQLAVEGISFGDILDDVRRARAEQLLTTTDIPLGQVAGLVGLAEQASLSRNARRWWNTTPTAVRRASKAARRTSSNVIDGIR